MWGQNFFNLGDQSTKKWSYFEPAKLADEERRRYKWDACYWICSKNHTVKANTQVDGKATLCGVCGETLDGLVIVYLTISLWLLKLCAENSTAVMIRKNNRDSNNAPASIPYTQFVKLLFSNH